MDNWREGEGCSSCSGLYGHISPLKVIVIIIIIIIITTIIINSYWLS